MQLLSSNIHLVKESSFLLIWMIEEDKYKPISKMFEDNVLEQCSLHFLKYIL